jgi:hypothetical protein
MKTLDGGLAASAFVDVVSSASNAKVLKKLGLGARTTRSGTVFPSRSGGHPVTGCRSRLREPGPGVRLEALRGAVAMSVPLLVGGAGARPSRPPSGCILVEDLAGTLDWMRRRAASRSATG